MKTIVVIPAYNEESTIYEVVTRALKYADVSVTDDGSKDRTPEILRSIQKEVAAKKHKHSLNVITHTKSTHIPKGIQDGLRYAVEKKYDICITMDAGLSHDPDALPDFMSADPRADVVIGARKEVENVPLYRKAISKLAAGVVNYSLSNSALPGFGPGISDCTSGFRRYSRRAFEKIAQTELYSLAFDFHMEALAICFRSGLKVIEIPIHYVFSNSSFNWNVLKRGIRFGVHLISTKGEDIAGATPSPSN